MWHHYCRPGGRAHRSDTRRGPGQRRRDHRSGGARRRRGLRPHHAEGARGACRAGGGPRGVRPRLDPAVRWHASATEGEWRDGRRGRHRGGSSRFPAGWRAHCSEPTRAPLRGSHADRPLREGRGGHWRPDPRHPQDHPRPAGAGEARGGHGRGRQPPGRTRSTQFWSRKTTRRLRAESAPAARAARAGAPRGMLVEVECRDLRGRGGARRKGSLGYSSTTWRPASSARRSRWRRDGQSWRPPAG